MISTKRKLMTVFLCTSIMGNGLIRSARANDILENQNDQQKEQILRTFPGASYSISVPLPKEGFSGHAWRG